MYCSLNIMYKVHARLEHCLLINVKTLSLHYEQNDENIKIQNINQCLFLSEF